MKKNPRSLKTKIVKYKTENFTLEKESTNQWKVSGRDSNGVYRRLRFEAKCLQYAMEKGEEILHSSDPCSKAKSPVVLNPKTMRISDAFLQAMATRNWTDYTERVEQYHVSYFLKWADKCKLKKWKDIRYEHILQYKKELIHRGLAFDTVRLYLRPIRQTAFWMSSNWPEIHINFCQHIRLSRNEFRTGSYDEEEGGSYLTIHQALEFLDWLSRDTHRDRLTVGVALQTLVGMQMKEVLRMEWDKVDLQEETVTIDGEVKNRYRIRRVPVPKVVAWILRRARNSRPVMEKLLPEFGDFNPYSRAVKRALHEWNPNLTVKTKDFRNTLQTTAIDQGWYGYYVQRYVGHAPKTVGERHYHADQGKRLIPLYREKVVAQIDKNILEWKAPANSPIYPGLRLALSV